MTAIFLHCFKCDKKTDLPYRCKFCSQRFCSEHRLPEAHDCLGLEKLRKDPEKRAAIRAPTRSYQPAKRKKKFRLSFGGLEGKVSYLILAICILVFILQITIPGFTSKYYFNPANFEANPMTFITSIFMHGSVNHLLLNMIMLFFFGTLLERKIGTGRFLFIYILSGIVGNLGYLAFTTFTGIPVPALGASGALYGIFATLAIIDPKIVVYVYFVIPLKITYALILFAALDILLINANTGIASAAHLAGVVIGLIYGWYLKTYEGIYEEKTYFDHL